MLPSTTSNGPLDVIGLDDATKQGDLRSWAYGAGERLTLTWKGPAQKIIDLYSTLVQVAGYSPNYEGVDLNINGGRSTVTAIMIDDAEPVYELFANNEQSKVQQHPYFQNSLTSSEIRAVEVAYASGATTVPATFSARQTVLLKTLWQGVHFFIRSSYVLRESKIVTKRSTVSASYSNVNEVEQPPDTSAVNTLIGALPSGEWLKQSPNVTRLGKRRWSITQEWWWAPSWHVMYGGSFTPS